MIREDYILKMIEQVAALIVRILNRSVSQESIEGELESLTEQWIGLPVSMLLSLHVDEVYRLFEDSDRMVVEKSYLMGEICRVKGITSESIDEREEVFAKALFFFKKCSGLVSEKLQTEIDKKVDELGETVQGEVSRNRESTTDDSLELTETKQSVSKTTLTRQRKHKSATMFWWIVTVCLVGTGAYSFFGQDEIEITDVNWGFEDGLAQAEFRIENNTDKDRLVRLKLSVEDNSGDVFGSEYTFLGSVEREYHIASESSKKVGEAFEYLSKSPRPTQSISIAILSNKSVDSTPASAPR